MPDAAKLTPELLSLLVFAMWPVVLVMALGTWRVLQVLGGKKRANEFPGGTPHGPEMYWRLNRAHLNTLENLPIFAAVVITAHLAGVHSGTTVLLAQTAVAARVIQSLIHIASGTPMAVNLRFLAYLTQLIAFVGLALIIVTS